MNTTLIESGGNMAREAAAHRGIWHEPLFGLVPISLLMTVVTVLLVSLIFWWLMKGSQKNNDTPMTLLKKRYVLGEIDHKTYLKMKEDIAD